ncbi:hypothetical protein [Catenulispora sp. GAS73]|uniref:hypothetical protein n=1 Tax=Catenulispora sp. GAS73 TaxID=3156269 RepID=UPI003511B585
MSIAAKDGAAPPTVPDAAARVLEFTQVARPADVPLIINALTAAELSAGIARLGLRLPPTVIEHVVTHGPRTARNTLAWQLRQPPRPALVRFPFMGNLSNQNAARNVTAPHHRAADPAADRHAHRDPHPHPDLHPSPNHPNPVHDTARRRLLALADPDIDRALFGRLEQLGIPWVRSAILRDRLGPDGKPIVPPDLRAKLAAFLTTAVLPISPDHLADTATDDPEFELLRVLAAAHDPALSLPAARILGLPAPIPAHQPGWRDQAWVQRWDRPGAGSCSWRLDWDEVLALAADHETVAGDRGRFLARVAGLDEAAAREDIPADVRHQLLASYPQAAWHVAAPDVTTLRRIATAVTTLRRRWDGFEQHPEFSTSISELFIRGLSLGSLTAADVIDHAVPASAVLNLAWRRHADDILPAARGRADLAEEIRALLDRRLGDDVPLWTALLVRSFIWTGTVAEFIDSTAVLGPQQAIPDEEELDDAAEDVPSANVLLAFARPHVQLEVLSDGPGELNSFELALLEGSPLAPGLVSRALADDAGFDARRALAANPVTPLAVLQRLLHDPVDPIGTRLAMLYDVADPGVRYAALEMLEQSGAAWPQILHFVQNMDEACVYQLIAAAPTAERLHFLLKKFGRYLGPDSSLLLYGRLAAEAGPEPVWDAAMSAPNGLEHAGSSVRASMAGGGVEPLLAGAGAVAQTDIPGVTVPDPDLAYTPHPDDPAHWPLENAVRQHLDNDAHRWRIMVRRLMEAGPLEYAQLVDLVEAIGDGAGEAAEGEP